MKKKPFLRTLCLLLAFPLMLSVGGCAKRKPEPAEREYNEQGYRVLPFSRGINLSCMEYPWYFTMATYWKMKKSKTYADIASQGFDHVRIPVKFSLHYDREKKRLDERFMKNLDRAIKKAQDAGLYVCLDYLGEGQLDTSVPGEKEMFVTIWRLVAERYREYSDFLSFEIINEPFPNWPGGNLDLDNLNLLQREVIAVIRESNPDRLILAAAADSNAAFRLKDMKLPRDDKNIALVVHVYDPGEFTHQGATWSDPNNNKQVRLTPEMLEKFKQRIDVCRDFVKKTGIPVVINEFGVNKGLTDTGDLTEYLAAFTSYCEENGLAWTYWNYWEYGPGGFGATKGGKWIPCVTDGLFPDNAETKGP